MVTARTPGPGAPKGAGAAPVPRQPVSRMFGRAFVLACPWCGSRRTFLRGWFRRYDRCRTCGVSWRREEGFELGAVTVNTILTFGAITVAMAVGIVLTVPDIPALPLVIGLLALAVVMPVAIYPFTYTIWLAFDLAVHPPDRAELDEAMAAVASGAAGQPPAPAGRSPGRRQRRSRST